MLLSTIIFLFFLFTTYALFLLGSRRQLADQERLQHRVREALQETVDGPEGAIKIVREDPIGGNATIHRILLKLNFVSRLEVMIKQADVQITVYRLLLFCVLAGIMAGLAAATIFNIVAALVFAVTAAALPIFHIARARSKRLRAFNSQLPDTLDLMSRSLAVGHAFSESLHQVAMEMPDPIATEFRVAFEEQKLGLSTKLALDRLAERVPLLDLRLCVTAMHIQRETGGNLAEILEKVSLTIRERFRIMEDFRTLTTSSRLSGWILCALPFALVFLLTLFNPEYMAVLIRDSRGHYVLAFAFVWQMFGMLLIRKILSIKV
ncbi:MAG TPA: type II secretion system F family protein [Pyrinomonadaceae bacterium]|nr:type II secretion system F family protein [Pyrinomonadaceae bacterium]